MKFEEVLPALREGKKIRRKDIVWGNFYGVLFISETENEILSDNVDNYDYKIIKEDLLAEDWEIVKEKVKLRDLTKEQFEKWMRKKCGTFKDRCCGCPFEKVPCYSSPEFAVYCWFDNKDLYSDKFLNQEIEIEEE